MLIQYYVTMMYFRNISSGYLFPVLNQWHFILCDFAKMFYSTFINSALSSNIPGTSMWLWVYDCVHKPCVFMFYVYKYRATKISCQRCLFFIIIEQIDVWITGNYVAILILTEPLEVLPLSTLKFVIIWPFACKIWYHCFLLTYMGNDLS